ncbi:alcohol dehydrogenase catalytic domain-containing protein [Bacillus sp. FJAT-27251]|uniref:alcohol dehydrogenase catalytic domain-containing protein n=1 Tax=Bacillus sp. FJAT-27251 TaxID=1684142 RepID=UPI0006A7684C|nr:alcohol dehydrogenase catalytic domain-containing protein [Bacillus sp. FJAT-27251]
MKAVTYQRIKNVEVREVKDPVIKNKDDIIIKVTSSAICGSDLHLIHAMIPNTPTDFVIGHEPMGIVEEVGANVTKLKKGDRVIIPFNAACGNCWYCSHDLTSQCDNSNPHGEIGGFMGYSESNGGIAGGQAEYMRVPYGNFTPFKLPDDCEMEDEKLALLADAAPTAFWSVDHAGVKGGETVVDYRLEHAKRTNKVETINFEQHENTGEYIKELNQGGADIVIDAVGMDGKFTPLEFLATGLKLQGGAMGALVMASQAVRKAGTIQVTGDYGGRYNSFPLGDLFQRNGDLNMGQAPVIPYMPFLYDLAKQEKVDMADIITHVLPLDQAKHGYEVFNTPTDNCIKVVLRP